MRHRVMQASAPLAIFGGAMLVGLAVSAVGLLLDPRIITGAPAWLKPAKFFASLAIYTLTLAAIFTLLPAWTRMRRVVGWVTVLSLTVEMVIILGQMARGTTSHFNVATPTDAALFSAMGLIIVAQTLTTTAVAVALWRSPFADPALGRALRLGMMLTIVGAFSGMLMAPPRPSQLAEAARTGQRMTVSGAHTVGAPDGGPGLPGTGWSTEHGDLRVAHFVGLHALQILPFIALALRRRLADQARLRVVAVAAAAHVTLFALLIWQALRGQSLIAPDQVTLMAFGLWAALVTAALTVAVLRPATVRQPAVAR